MALGAVTGALGIAQGVGGLFGGGGPRQPRMNRAQKKALKSQANLNNAMAQLMRQMTQMLRQGHQGMMGRRCGAPQGPCSQRGMNGAGCCGQNNGFPRQPFGNMFGGQQGGTNININLGGGVPFGPPPMMGAHFAMGVNLFA